MNTTPQKQKLAEAIARLATLQRLQQQDNPPAKAELLRNLARSQAAAVKLCHKAVEYENEQAARVTPGRRDA